MFRTALRPRWLALLGLVVVVCVLFGWLGLWQLDVARHKDQTELLQQIEAAPPAPIDDVLAPQTSVTGREVGRRVHAAGRYDAAHQLLVTGRRLDGRVGAWVLTPLVVDTTGARLAVIRGFVDDGTPAPPVPGGTVTVKGTLQPQEGPPDERVPQPPGHIQTVDLSALVNTWGGDVYNAFVFAAEEQPAPTGPSAQVTRVPPPAPAAGGVNVRNFAYAIQWWIFAGFAVYLWWRMVRDDHALRQAAGDPRGPDDDPNRPDEDPHRDPHDDPGRAHGDPGRAADERPDRPGRPVDDGSDPNRTIPSGGTSR